MSRAVMQQALEALEGVAQWVEKRPDTHPWDAWQRIDPAITALRSALAEPEQPISSVTEAVTKTVIEIEKLLCEKLGRKWQASGMGIETLINELTSRKALAEPEQEPISLNNGRLTQYPDGSIGVGTPTPRKPEQPYDQTALDLCKVCGWRTLIPGDACLNCERSKQPEQEPVCDKDPGDCWNVRCQLGKVCKNTAPTPRKPLTYDELEPLCEAFDSYDTTQNELVEFARAIERAHGIGEQHE